MRARDLLKWKRALNEIKIKHEELELIKEICRVSYVYGGILRAKWYKLE